MGAELGKLTLVICLGDVIFGGVIRVFNLGEVNGLEVGVVVG